MSETIQKFEPVDLPGARRTAPASDPVPAEPESPRARIVTPEEGRRAPQKKRLLFGVALSVLVVGAGASVWLQQHPALHRNNTAMAPVQADAPAPGSAPGQTHAGTNAAHPEHGPAALKMPAPEPSPVTGKTAPTATAAATVQPVIGTLPAPSGATGQPATPAQSSVSVQDDARPAPVPMQQVVDLLLKRLGELEAAQKQETAERKALGDTLEQQDTALTAAMNREAGRLDEISGSLHSMLIAVQTPKAPEVKASVAPGNATVSAPAPIRHATSITPGPSVQKKEGVAAPRAEGERRARYAIDAASPSIAIIHMAGGRAIELRVGDVLPGYGHVRLIEQVGDAWFIRTDNGTIR